MTMQDSIDAVESALDRLDRGTDALEDLAYDFLSAEMAYPGQDESLPFDLPDPFSF